jgi:hypothetical protein
MKDKFKVVCLLDADMLCVYNFEHIFRMADTGTILACSNNTLFRYIKKDFNLLFIDAPDDIDIVQTSFSTVPFFINPNIHQKFLTDVWTSKTGNDLCVPNLIAAASGLMKQVYLLNSQNWTNIHHTMIKPNLFIKKVQDGYVSDLGERIFTFHGHWLDRTPGGYIDELIRPMEKNYGYHRPYIETAKNCIRIIKEEYDKYL